MLLSKLLFVVSVFSSLVFAQDVVKVFPILFHGNQYFSDRPVAEKEGRLIYIDTGEDFVVANGSKVDISYKRPSTKPLCYGCQDESNSPASILGRKTLIIRHNVEPLTLTKAEIEWGGKKVELMDGRVVIRKEDGSYFFRDEEKEQ